MKHIVVVHAELPQTAFQNTPFKKSELFLIVIIPFIKYIQRRDLWALSYPVESNIPMQLPPFPTLESDDLQYHVSMKLQKEWSQPFGLLREGSCLQTFLTTQVVSSQKKARHMLLQTKENKPLKKMRKYLSHRNRYLIEKWNSYLTTGTYKVNA